MWDDGKGIEVLDISSSPYFFVLAEGHTVRVEAGGANTDTRSFSYLYLFLAVESSSGLELG